MPRIIDPLPNPTKATPMPVQLALVFSLIVLLSACSHVVEGNDGPDASAIDANEQFDANEFFDAGGDDAGEVDAGLPDAGEPPDAGPGPCDLLDKNDCGEGLKCTIVGSKHTEGCGPAGAQGELDGCASDRDCAPGLYCSYDFDKKLKCHAFCHQDADCPRPNEKCKMWPTGYAGAAPILCANLIPCDPVLQDCSDPSNGCYVLEANGTTTCMPAGTLPIGKRCNNVNDCAEGATCFNSPTGGAACYKLCDPAAPTDTCPGPTACTPISGGSAVGICSAG